MNTRKAEANKTVLAEQFLDAIDLNDAEMDKVVGSCHRHHNDDNGGDRDRDRRDFRRDDRREDNTNINIILLNSISCLGGWW